MAWTNPVPVCFKQGWFAHAYDILFSFYLGLPEISKKERLLP
jgi:hypothetical protein